MKGIAIRDIMEKLRLEAPNMRRSKISILRNMLPYLEQLFSEGVPHAEVISGLNAAGLQISQSTFENALFRIRKKGGKCEKTDVIRGRPVIDEDIDNQNVTVPSPSSAITNPGELRRLRERSSKIAGDAI